MVDVVLTFFRLPVRVKLVPQTYTWQRLTTGIEINTSYKYFRTSMRKPGRNKQNYQKVGIFRGAFMSLYLVF